MNYRQCTFSRGSERTIAWIEERGAKIGARVEITTLDDGPLWTVDAVTSAPLSAEALKEKQDLDRNTFVDDKRRRKSRNTE